MGVSIADIVGANDENKKGVDVETEEVEGSKFEVLTAYAPIAEQAIETYLKITGGDRTVNAILPVLGSNKEAPDSKYVFMVQIDQGEAVGMVVFPVEELGNIFNILMGAFSDHIES